MTANVVVVGPATRQLRARAGAERQNRRPRVALAGVVAVVVVAWGALIVAERSGLARHAHHDAVLDGSGSGWMGIGLFAAGWVVMVVAMMVPFVIPVAVRVPRGADPLAGPALAVFVVGFLLAWSVAGTLLLALDAAVHEAVHGVPGLEARPWLVATAVLGLAAALQLAPATERQLARCTLPLPGGTGGVRAAWIAGRDHGIRCVRADGPLMLVMFAAGAGLAWMALVTAAMAGQRWSRGRRHVARATGVALLVAAALTAWTPGGLWGPLTLGS